MASGQGFGAWCYFSSVLLETKINLFSPTHPPHKCWKGRHSTLCLTIKSFAFEAITHWLQCNFVWVPINTGVRACLSMNRLTLKQYQCNEWDAASMRQLLVVLPMTLRLSIIYPLMIINLAVCITSVPAMTNPFFILQGSYVTEYIPCMKALTHSWKSLGERIMDRKGHHWQYCMLSAPPLASLGSRDLIVTFVNTSAWLHPAKKLFISCWQAVTIGSTIKSQQKQPLLQKEHDTFLLPYEKLSGKRKRELWTLMTRDRIALNH